MPRSLRSCASRDLSIRKASFGDAEDPKFREVEEKGRWINCLGIEGRKAQESAVAE
jgi:hypothetical protein